MLKTKGQLILTEPRVNFFEFYLNFVFQVVQIVISQHQTGVIDKQCGIKIAYQRNFINAQ